MGVAATDSGAHEEVVVESRDSVPPGQEVTFWELQTAGGVKVRENGISVIL